MSLGLHTVPEGIAINSLGQEKSGLVGNHLCGVPDVLWGDLVFIHTSLGNEIQQARHTCLPLSWIEHFQYRVGDKFKQHNE